MLHCHSTSVNQQVHAQPGKHKTTPNSVSLTEVNNKHATTVNISASFSVGSLSKRRFSQNNMSDINSRKHTTCIQFFIILWSGNVGLSIAPARP